MSLRTAAIRTRPHRGAACWCRLSDRAGEWTPQTWATPTDGAAGRRKLTVAERRTRHVRELPRPGA
ncbi:MAG: hypothetical protein OXG81_13875 [Acidobacteria bacterium]|nr:hypothetical protein [Acidobacteriota bacterium]